MSEIILNPSDLLKLKSPPGLFWQVDAIVEDENESLIEISPLCHEGNIDSIRTMVPWEIIKAAIEGDILIRYIVVGVQMPCLLYTSPSPRDS